MEFGIVLFIIGGICFIGTFGSIGLFDNISAHGADSVFKKLLLKIVTPVVGWLEGPDKSWTRMTISFVAGICCIVISVILIVNGVGDSGSSTKWSDLSETEKNNIRYSHELYEYIHGND